MRRTLCRAGLAIALSTLPARADIMHWFWEVEVNGEAVDASRPIAIAPGDHAEIRLWAGMAPQREGFAESLFAIAAGDEFFALGKVNIDPCDGYGLGDTLDNYIPGDGEFADSDASGLPDTIDAIHPFQIPFEIPPNDTDLSNPILVYSLGWTIPPSAAPGAPIILVRVPTLAGEFLNTVYLDGWGATADYTSADEVLVFIPTPPMPALLALTACAAARHRQRAASVPHRNAEGAGRAPAKPGQA